MELILRVRSSVMDRLARRYSKESEIKGKFVCHDRRFQFCIGGGIQSKKNSHSQYRVSFNFDGI